MNDPSVSARHDYILRTALWELSQCFSGGMGWVAALYLMMTKLAPRTTTWPQKCTCSMQCTRYDTLYPCTARRPTCLLRATGPKRGAPSYAARRDLLLLIVHRR